jgi:hypothetical protein
VRFDGPVHVALQSGRGETHTRVALRLAAMPQPAGANADQALQLLQLPARAAIYQRRLERARVRGARALSRRRDQ